MAEFKDCPLQYPGPLRSLFSCAISAWNSSKKKLLCHVPWEANEDISLVEYGHQPKELEVLGMLWGREAWIDQVPDVPRLVDVYVLIYEVKDWLQMSPTNLETWSKPLVNA